MTWLLRAVWSYRNEILLTIQLLEKMRKTAAETAREYIRIQVRKSLLKGLLGLAFQILLLGLAHQLNGYKPGLESQLYASAVLWLITLNNLFQLFFFTVPELKGVYRMLRGKVGFTMKHFLGVSVVSELTHPNLITLAACFALGWGSRTQLSQSFSYFEPWLRWFGH